MRTLINVSLNSFLPQIRKWDDVIQRVRWEHSDPTWTEVIY